MNKRFAPPPRQTRRRDKGNGKLSLHTERGIDGKAEPYKLDEKRRPLWKFTYRLRPGPGGSQSFAALDWADAERLSALVAEQLKTGSAGSGTPLAERTVNQICDHLLAVRGHRDSSTRESTVTGYERDLERLVRPYFGTRLVGDITPEDVDRWKATHAAEGKARTRQKRVNLLASVFKLAVTDGWISTSPVLRRHRVRVLKLGEQDGKLRGDQRIAQVLSAEQVAQVLGKLDADDPALRLLVELTGRMGFRLREITHARAEDATFYPDGSAFIAVASGIDCSCRDCRGTRLTKAGSARLVPIPMDLQDSVRAFLEARRARFGMTGALFPVWRAKPRQRTRPGQLRVARTVSDAFIGSCRGCGARHRAGGWRGVPRFEGHGEDPPLARGGQPDCDGRGAGARAPRHERDLRAVCEAAEPCSTGASSRAGSPR